MFVYLFETYVIPYFLTDSNENSALNSLYSLKINFAIKDFLAPLKRDEKKVKIGVKIHNLMSIEE